MTLTKGWYARLGSALLGMFVLLGLTISPAQAAVVNKVTVTYTHNGACGNFISNARYHNDTVTHSDQLYGVWVQRTGGNIVHVRVNEATTGLENWITTADIVMNPGNPVIVGTTGSPWRPSGKVSIIVWKQGVAFPCTFSAYTYNS